MNIACRPTEEPTNADAAWKKQAEPKISVIVPIYCAQAYLDETLTSIQKQTLRDIEIICVIDGSPDDSAAIAKAHSKTDPRIHIIDCAQNSGTGAAVNKGIEAATGTYVQIVGNDDLLVPHALERLYNFCEDNELDFCQYGVDVFCDDPNDDYLSERTRVKRAYHEIAHEYPVAPGIEILKMTVQNHEYRMSNGSEIVRRDLLGQKIRNLEGLHHEDMYYTFRVFLESKRCTLLNEALYSYRVRNGSVETTKRDRMKTAIECYSFIATCEAMLDALPPSLMEDATFAPVIEAEITPYLVIATQRFSHLPPEERGKLVAKKTKTMALIAPTLQLYAKDAKRRDAHVDARPEGTVAVSVVIPAYNAADNLRKSIDSLLAQTIPTEKLEIIVVDDGSTDETPSICDEYCEAFANVISIHQSNSGVSSARNAGIERATGAYIAFLDSDDELAPETLEALVSFFDSHYDEVDLVSYPMRIYNDKREWGHVREQVLKKTGVYDLRKIQNAFALITNVNVMVKNTPDLPRFRTDLIVHEDEFFFTTLLLRKLKVGFCKAGSYRYQQLPGSAIATKMHPFYQFEKNIGFWEELFARYRYGAPLYLQAAFVNEINWKTQQDIVFPYHYAPEELAEAKMRIGRIMDRVAPDLVFTAPRADEYLRNYLLSLKTDSNCACKIENGGFTLSDRNGTVLLCRNAATIEFVRCICENDSLLVKGVLKSVLFSYAGDLRLELTIGEDEPTPLALKPSATSRHKSHIRTADFQSFQAKIPLNRAVNASFSLHVDGERVNLRPVFTRRSRFSPAKGLATVAFGKTLVEASRLEAKFAIRPRASSSARLSAWTKNTLHAVALNKKIGPVRLAAFGRTKPIWLYHDRAGVGKDNAYYQFLHDFDKNDGIERYYVTADDEATVACLFEKKHLSNVIPFRSTKHKLLFLKASKILASYIENPNWMPFKPHVINGLSDIVDFELVYLQHGVLHAHTPWKYAADKLLADKVVVSTHYETANFKSIYGYEPDQLITSGMPRYDHIDLRSAAKHRILFAPSWRKYLVSEGVDLRFRAKHAAFDASRFWEETRAFLSSERLRELLERYDFQIDIKLHPIFKAYEDKFSQLETARIHLVDSADETDYALFVTDYSSWVFDFVYQMCPIVYFLPDREEFNAGLNGYHKLDLPLEEGFGPLTTTAVELLDELEKFFKSRKPAALHAKRMENFFLHYDENQCERLYKALVGVTTP